MSEQMEWLYNPHAKPAKELSKHDQQMIQLGWDAHKTLRLDRPELRDIHAITDCLATKVVGAAGRKGWDAVSQYVKDADSKLLALLDIERRVSEALEENTSSIIEEALAKARIEIAELSKKLDDREEDLIEAKKPLLKRIEELEAQIARNSNREV